MEESQVKVLDERLESLIKPSKEQETVIKTEESLTLEEVLDKQW